MRTIIFATSLLAGTMVLGHEGCRPKALIYRGPAACEDCPESIASRLKSSASHFEVKFAGPNEDIDITAEALKDVQLYVQPGGGGKKNLVGMEFKHYLTLVAHLYRS